MFSSWLDILLRTGATVYSVNRQLTRSTRLRSKPRSCQTRSTIKLKTHIKNLSNKELTNDQINLLAKGLKFIPTPATKQNQIRQQLLCDFDQFARRMRLIYIFRGEDKKTHPCHVKSTWIPPIQKSVALESYLEEVKSDFSEIEITKPKDNLLPAERKAQRALKRDSELNLKKADKGTTTVVTNKRDKILPFLSEMTAILSIFLS